jgi:hypothetical protein
MAAGAYSGAWRRAQYFEAPEAVHTVDSEHQVRGQLHDPQTDAWTAERVSLPPGLDAYTDREADEAQVTTPGLVIDRSDYSEAGHQHRGTHDEDLGAARAQNWAEKGIRGPNETYRQQSVTSFRPENMQPTDENLRRGVNSHPMNNPPLEMYDGEGFRIGTWDFAERGRLRQYLSRVLRSDHGIRPVSPNTTYVPPERADVREVPLWSSLARSILQTEKRPMLRRAPPSIGETLIEDGGPSPDDAASIVGAF